MLKSTFAALVVLLFAFSVSFAGSGPNMQEGKWEITTKVEMPGMPMNMPPMTHTQCLTKDDFVPQNSQSGEECQKPPGWLLRRQREWMEEPGVFELPRRKIPRRLWQPATP